MSERTMPKDQSDGASEAPAAEANPVVPASDPNPAANAEAPKPESAAANAAAPAATDAAAAKPEAAEAEAAEPVAAEPASAEPVAAKPEAAEAESAAPEAAAPAAESRIRVVDPEEMAAESETEVIKRAPAAEEKTAVIPAPRAPKEPETVIMPVVKATDPETVAIPLAKVSEPATVVIPAVKPAPAKPAEPATAKIPAPQPKPAARPVHIPAAPQPAAPTPKTTSKRTLIGLTAAAAAVLAIILIGFGIKNHNDATSPQAMVEKTINAYSHALSTGDLATLRDVTTGQLSDFYKGMSQQTFSDVYRTQVQQKSIPVIDSVDDVQVTGQTAQAQVTAYIPSQPSAKSPRSLTLQNTPTGWKVSG